MSLGGMSFTSSLATQVAAVVDELAKAAVAEITKLMEDGSVVLRMEMCRKDGEIQELRRSLRLMEVELRDALEAAAITRAAEEERREQAAASRVLREEDTNEDHKTCAADLEPTSARSLCEPGHGTEESRGTRPAVKHEPADDELATRETTHDAITADICFEAGERDDLIWPPPACCMFEKSPVAMQPHIPMFPPQAEQYAAHRNTESSGNSSSAAAEEMADDSLSVPIKVEVDIQPMCMGSTRHPAPSTPSESAHNGRIVHASHPAVSQDQCLLSALQQAGPSLAPPVAQRSAANAFGLNTGEPIPNRNSLRVKKVMNVWKTNQKLFICSVCNRGFSRMSQLEEHKASHQLFKPFRCLQCGKSFTQKTRLKTHQSVHTGERPFSCKICGKMFSRQDNCLRHERFHSGLKPYSCEQCGKSFTVLGNLKIHQEIHLQGR